MYKLGSVVPLFLFALVVLPGSANAQLAEIVVEYCEDVLRLAEDGLQEVSEATADLADCAVELDDCMTGIFGGDPIECIRDYNRCIGSNEQAQACSEFVREFTTATRRAERSARRQDVEDGFRLFLTTDAGQECLDPALTVAALCAGIAID